MTDDRRREYRRFRERGYRALEAWRHAALEMQLVALEDAGAVRVRLELDDDPFCMAPCTGDERADAAWRDDVAAGRLEVYVVLLERPHPHTCTYSGPAWETIGALGGVDVYAGDSDGYTRHCARELLEEHLPEWTRGLCVS